MDPVLPLRRNMDIVGVPGIAAEAELLAAIALFLERLGLSAQDVVIKVSSRKVLQAILERYGVPEDAVGPVSVIVDKMEKIPLEKASQPASDVLVTVWQFIASSARASHLAQVTVDVQC